nr:MAG TPA: hypothetical protein [Caudoviricetes sp.]
MLLPITYWSFIHSIFFLLQKSNETSLKRREKLRKCID